MNTSKEIKSKLNLIIISFLILIGAISIYLFHLQVNLKSLFYKLSHKNYTRIKNISSTRGDILDCQGRLLATNKPINIISWVGTGNKALSYKQIDTLKEITKILKLDFKDLLPKVQKSEKLKSKTLIHGNIKFDILSQIIERFYENKNIKVESEYKRLYPYQSLCSHILGYLGSINLQFAGKMGLELLCEKILKGQPGKLITTINSFGRQIETKELEKALNGKAINITLNIDIQKIIEQIFPKDYAGASVIMEANSGDIKALFSCPSFDPNIFLNSINSNTWNNLQKKHSFINRVFNASYPPASLFKLVTLCAALEENLIDCENIWNCKGFTKFGNRRYFCGRRWGHGNLNLKEALAKSCNIPFYEIGKKIKIDTLAKYARILGLGERTNIMFQERTGLIPTNNWKLKYKKERWWPGETLSAVIGQSFILTTPLQIACMMGALCTGYRVKPRILTTDPVVKEKVNIKSKNLDFLRKCMKSVVKVGTGKSLSKRLEDFTIYAKTGTAQTSTLNNKLNQNKSHAWIMAYIKPKDKNNIYKEPIVLVILIEHAGSAKLATSVAKNFLTQYKSYISKL